MIQLTLTLKITTAQVVETSVTVNNNSPIQDYVHPNDRTQTHLRVDYWVKTFQKPFTLFSLLNSSTVEPPLKATSLQQPLFWQTVHTLTLRVLSRIYLLTEKSRVAKGNELPRGVWGHAPPPPPTLFEMNMHWDAIWCILRLNFAKCYSVCTNLVMFGWFFRYSYLYTVMRTIFFGGKTGHFRGGGKLLPLKHPR